MTKKTGKTRWISGAAGALAATAALTLSSPAALATTNSSTESAFGSAGATGAAGAVGVSASTALGVATGSSQATQLEGPDLVTSNAMAHLRKFQAIADNNGDNRRTGQPGYRASVSWVRSKLVEAGYKTQVQSFSTPYGTSYNVIAEWPKAESTNVVMSGAHLDGIGPGINDNGSGSAAVLETALAWAKSGKTPKNTLRFGFWGAEEQGLLGSNHYVRNLPQSERDRVGLYMNYDMVGSPNPGYFVYDDNPAGDTARDELTAYYESKNIPWEYVDVQGRSDHASFRSLGIPTTGIFTGAEGAMSSSQASKWGGQAGRAFDPCYHRDCDTTDNISREAMARNLDAIGYMVWKYADKELTAAQMRPAA